MGRPVLVERDEGEHVSEIHQKCEPGLPGPFTQPVVGQMIVCDENIVTVRTDYVRNDDTMSQNDNPKIPAIKYRRE